MNVSTASWLVEVGIGFPIPTDVAKMRCPRFGLLESSAEAGEDLVVLPLKLVENGSGGYLQRHSDVQVRIG